MIRAVQYANDTQVGLHNYVECKHHLPVTTRLKRTHRRKNKKSLSEQLREERLRLFPESAQREKPRGAHSPETLSKRQHYTNKTREQLNEYAREYRRKNRQKLKEYNANYQRVRRLQASQALTGIEIHDQQPESL